MYEKAQSARIYRPGFIDKNDHVMSWNKDLLSQIIWFEKKLVSILLFNFCLYQHKYSKTNRVGYLPTQFTEADPEILKKGGSLC